MSTHDDVADQEETVHDLFVACTKASKKLGATADKISPEAFVSVCEHQAMKMCKLINFANTPTLHATDGAAAQ